MPRLIDHEEREREIADAALRVLSRDGLTALSVRNVAAEAGIATASLRRAFPDQDVLRRFCLGHIRQNVTRRIERVRGEGREAVLAVLHELLPLDDERRVELTAHLQLGALALSDERLRPVLLAFNTALRDLCAALIAELARAGELSPSVDQAVEADALHALVDGTALHLLWSDGAADRERALRALAARVEALGAR
ncbi:TetR family transcriptional regulator C-terminal domain-containing protein [Leifsonia sp. F6_8S_P_1B]|uniref:TetR family transcriptional regulator C-terminal domain-containing protein n=1 Tax=Leifsonia williamsii TaxID=3035919 RepID=A0ABT8K6R6_9MICO|nr:TetR family transcriptional regulator C-terminal domain-containing protein [Leifsonia williamsii]MDN4613134.1 TetR family transcriptional regulator C-terminal domain-containing protein [Leifsonia williamsii]